MTISAFLSRITLNVNGLNSQLKRHRVAEQIKKTPYILSKRDSLQK